MTPSTTRFRAALATLGRSAASLAPALGCSAALCEKWLRVGPPADVLTWVEAGAGAWRSLPVPRVNTTAGRPKAPAPERV